ncbi:DUF456 family protein [Halanaerobacter jeridensis]|uniref:Uncharacterized protein YqgC (DUF456 family) n=1 Tax=Halanaerobacter jeridensis TaxID=706427 RepID=A0A938XSX9_9FIRM|nr:uncharacterized protein YqgC (DUF456 family) [Halanaerobacter jeridensis]
MIVNIIVTIIAVLGVLGTLVPVFPGTPLIVGAAIINGVATDFSVVSIRLIIILIGLSVLAEISERLFSAVTTKKFGGSKYGIIGAILGVLIGSLFFPPLGIFLGPVLGAVALELSTGKNIQESIKVGTGTVLGTFGGTLISFIIALMMASWLLVIIF